MISLYDLPKGNFAVGDRYQVRIGTSQLTAATTRTGSADRKYIDNELERMRIDNTGRTEMVADSIGTISLQVGSYELSLQSAGKIKGDELFRPRAIILVPVDSPKP